MDIREMGYKVYDKAKDIGRNVMQFGKNGIVWALNNPDKAAALAGATATITGGIIKASNAVNRNLVKRSIEREKRTRIYDHSMNAYIYTKRPLTSRQIDYINRERRRTGKRTSEILWEMGLLR